MKQEDKELLLEDLCARLPYGVMCRGEYEVDADYNRPFGGYEVIIDKAEGVEHIGFDDGEIYITIGGYQCDLFLVKPYLRPMSSMTEKERKEYTSYCFEQPFLQKDKTPNLGSVPMCIDWLNKKMFDYRGLIEKGLALEASEGIYKIK